MRYSVDPYLAHFGTKGQKWYVRRWQNEDGSLTPAGRIHYGIGKAKRTKGYDKYMDNEGNLTAVGRDRVGKLIATERVVSGSWDNQPTINSKEMVDKQKADAGVISVDRDTDIIKKGATLQRITTKGEEFDNKRKYMSILYDDKLQYQSMRDFLPTDDLAHQKDVTYETTGEMKVATYNKTKQELNKFIGDRRIYEYSSEFGIKYGQKVCNQIMADFGNIKLKNLLSDERTANVLESEGGKKYNKKDWVGNYMKVGSDAVAFASNRVCMSDKDSNAFFDHMKKLGYNAFVDPYDGSSGDFDYPLVVLNAKDNMKVTKEEKYYDDD